MRFNYSILFTSNKKIFNKLIFRRLIFFDFSCTNSSITACGVSSRFLISFEEAQSTNRKHIRFWTDKIQINFQRKQTSFILKYDILLFSLRAVTDLFRSDSDKDLKKDDVKKNKPKKIVHQFELDPHIIF